MNVPGPIDNIQGHGGINDANHGVATHHQCQQQPSNVDHSMSLIPEDPSQLPLLPQLFSISSLTNPNSSLESSDISMREFTSLKNVSNRRNTIDDIVLSPPTTRMIDHSMLLHPSAKNQLKGKQHQAGRKATTTTALAAMKVMRSKSLDDDDIKKNRQRFQYHYLMDDLLCSETQISITETTETMSVGTKATVSETITASTVETPTPTNKPALVMDVAAAPSPPRTSLLDALPAPPITTTIVEQEEIELTSQATTKVKTPPPAGQEYTLPQIDARETTTKTEATTTATATTTGTPVPPLPAKCFCNWKNCRAYQKAFREVQHPVFDGVIKIRLIQHQKESMVYKECLDRTLGISKSPEWKQFTSGNFCKYTIAKHHFTEQHIRKYNDNCKQYSFLKPFTIHGAKKYLYSVNPNEILPDQNNGSSSDMYLQCPNVPQEVVKKEFFKVMETVKQSKLKAASTVADESRNKSEQQLEVVVSATTASAMTPPPPPTLDKKQPNITAPTPKNNNKSVRKRKDDSEEMKAPTLSRNRPTPRTKREQQQAATSSIHNNKKVIHRATRDSAQQYEYEYDDNEEQQQEEDVDEDDEDHDDVKLARNLQLALAARRAMESRRTTEMIRLKDEENKMLKEQLELMKAQLNFLHDMVMKLQEHSIRMHASQSSTLHGSFATLATSTTSVSAAASITGGHKSSNNIKRQNHYQQQEQQRHRIKTPLQQQQEHQYPSNHANTTSRKTKTKKTEHGEIVKEDPDHVPDEINFNEENRKNKKAWTKSRSQTESDDGTGSDNDNNNEEEDDDGEVDDEDYDGDGTTIATTTTFASRFRHQMNSSSRIIMDEDDDYDEDDTMSLYSKGGISIVSASKSLKSLPRELELDEHGDDSDTEKHDDDEEHGRYQPTAIASTNKNISKDGKPEPQVSNTAVSPVVLSNGSSNNYDVTDQISTLQVQPPQVLSHNAAPTIYNDSNPDGKADESSNNQEIFLFHVNDMALGGPNGEKCSYCGTVNKLTGVPHGFGRMEYDDSSSVPAVEQGEGGGRRCWYEGDWVSGRFTGHGQLSNGFGDLYEGGWKDDLKHGYGVMQFSDGRMFEGEYDMDQMVHGKMTYQDGSSYEGAWCDGTRNGYGRCIFPDGSIYEGEFLHGEFSGYGKMEWSDGGSYVGNWVDGEMHGYGKEVRPDGSLRHDGEWIHGQPVRRPSCTDP